MSYVSITEDGQLADFCRELAECPWIAFDTEFVSEDSYRPVLCLVQVAAEDRLAIIDPLALEDMTPFWDVIAHGDQETIVHAGRGEVEFCYRAVGTMPKRLFDVQIAAAMVGVEYPASYRTLIQKLLEQDPHHGETRTDWRRRPLSERQLRYALDDVRYLAPLREAIGRGLDRLERTAWLEDEMRAWQDGVVESLANEPWRRVSGNSGMDRKSLAILRELWQWRESEAERRNCPARRVLRDDLMTELAKRQLAEPKQIRAVRGMERRDLKRLVDDMSDCIRRAAALPEDRWPDRRRRQPVPQLSVLGQFLFSALGSICRQKELSPGLVGSPSDVRELVAYRIGRITRPEPPRLARGWRAEVVGRTFDDLLAGKLAVRIDDPASEHPLVLEPTDP